MHYMIAVSLEMSDEPKKLLLPNILRKEKRMYLSTHPLFDVGLSQGE
jgi:hypothetical protein